MGRLIASIALGALALAAPVAAERVPSATSTRAVLEALSLAPDSARPAWRWRLARDYAARGLHAEADGVLRAIAADTPERARARDFRHLHAAVLVEIGEADAALALLDSGLGEDTRGACLTRLRANAALNRHLAALDAFRCADTQAPGDVLAAVRAAFALGDDVQSLALLARIAEIPGRHAAEADYWRGRIAQRRGQPALAASYFEKAAGGAHRVAALRARIALVELRVEHGDLDARAGLKALDGLRHVWRGGAAERDLLMAAGRLSDQVADRRGAFENYGAVAIYWQDQALRRELEARFAALFADGGQSMQPIEAFALFWDFQSFAPHGPEADAMVRKLAARLSGLGLGAQAASLLEHQVYNRLDGTARGVVAVQLAGLLNDSGHHARALAVLASTQADTLPAEVLREHRLAEAEALIGTGKAAAARALLAEETGSRAAHLRAEAAWALKDWNAVIAHERSALPRESEATRFVPVILRTAVAAAMEGDEMLLGQLRRRYAAALAGTEVGPAFDALTGDPGRVSADQLRAAVALAAERAVKSPTAGSPA